MDHVGRWRPTDTGGPVLHGSGKQVAEKIGALIEENSRAVGKVGILRGKSIRDRRDQRSAGD